MKMIKIESLSKSFGRHQALDRVSFSLGKGEVLGFIGPNGAGKSTTVRILLGMLKPTSGTAELFGQDAWKDAVEIHKRIAYVPGDVNLWPNLTGGEVIDLFLSMRGAAVDQDKKEALMKAFEFDPTKKCRAYSKGNRQKVALIAAFAADADLYIFDEPTSGLDPLQERVFQDQVRKVKARGASVLLSSHILSEVEALCDTVAIIRNGKIVETGKLEALKHLTRTQIRVKAERSLDHLKEKNWIHDYSKDKSETVFLLDTNHLADLLSELQNCNVTKFESAPPKLEDFFMRHYETDEEVD
ncbi:ABC transporter ATP-binding protein [Marinilactibacillus piezotolerans]|uniref:ABC transporter ATP-binding protein n=1 Tax=Marinilactibacillus piezotolerans TaxID=258723 RepID=UPI0009AFC0B3|nr:ABC transporter ATP-binding protein [Marinilactibacillus piezotolerans]